MTTFLVEFDLAGDGTPRFSRLVENIFNSPPDTATKTDNESDSVGLSHDGGSGIIVIRNRTLATLTNLLKPHLSNIPLPKVSQTLDKGVYDPPGYPVQQLSIYTPISNDDNYDGSDAKFQRLKTLFDVIYMQFEREEKVSGMRQGEITDPTSTALEYKGQKCKVWCVWVSWISEKVTYDKKKDTDASRDDEQGKERESLAKRIDWGETGVLGWEEKNWEFRTYEEFLKESSASCVVM
ncbi:hypothetical protein EYC80_010546 [Monilinia laxa]|uniref:Uncharacterized protein n=1 Tax=Monilinia laxa TaxID=61186 RepID=A0A5N6JQJ9_MONLA|nr:hypothetical protein EYC80_010546 [Monilinia laxa]